MADPLVSNQGLNIGGHKIPFALVMAGAAIVTVFLIMKSKSGASVAVGPQPVTATADPNAYGGNLAVGSPQEAQFANLTQQLSALQSSVLASQAPPPPPPPSFGTLTLRPLGLDRFPGQAGWDAASTALPLYANPALNSQSSFVPYGAQLTVTGLPVSATDDTSFTHAVTYYPVKSAAGQTGYVSATDIAQLYSAPIAQAA